MKKTYFDAGLKKIRDRVASSNKTKHLLVAVKNDVVKKTEYNKLVTKLDNIDTTNFFSRIKYQNDGSDLEKKISDVDKKITHVSGLVKKTDFNAKITEVERKIPSISGLATSSDLTAGENKYLKFSEKDIF